MREIKFRVWNKKLNAMAYFKDPVVNTNSPTTEIQIGLYGWKPKSKYDDDHYTLDLDTGKPILMQFTGIKNKDGKELYEGDILECQYRDIRGDVHHEEVFWSQVRKGWGLRSLWGQEKIDSMNPDFYMRKVIGNIYENPELLKLRSRG